MGRGRRDISKTQRALKKILDGVPYKIIAHEEGIPFRSVAWIKGTYTKEIKSLKLNDAGRRLMAEEQLSLPLHSNSPRHRVDTRLNSSRTEEAKLRRRLSRR